MSAVPDRRPVDQEARDRALSDLDGSFCMEAGAGTGKTTLLVGRYIPTVKSGKAECRQIVAITFTEKAAAEMKSRLRRGLEAELEAADPAEVVHARLAAAVEEIEGAPISTIHSFASSILREYPVEAGIDPGFRLLSEIEHSLILGECWTEFVSSASQAEPGLMRDWATAGGTTGRLKEMAMSLYASRSGRVLSGMFDDHRGGDAGAQPEKRSGAGTFVSDLEAGASELASLLESSAVAPGDAGADTIASFLADIDSLRSGDGGIDAKEALSLTIPKGAGSMKNWEPREACRRQKALFGSLAASQGSARETFAGELRDRLERWLEGFISSVESRKVAEGALDFDDLLIKARALLDSGDVLGELRNRYRYFLVDEFQDTDPVQAEIVMLLSGGAGGAGGEDDASGNLFIVGDPKQSIYRFRRADIEIYEKVKRGFRSGGRLLSISQNFRSLPGITGWVNGLFPMIMKSPEGSYYQPDYEPVHPWREDGGARVVMLGISPDDDGADEFRKAEGEAVARFVSDLADSGMTVMDPVSRVPRPVKFGDMAILYRSTTGIEHYEGPLRRACIPYMVEGGKLFYTRQEIRDIAAAAWTIEDPADPLALVSCLRSEVFGLSDEELLMLRSSGGRFDYLDPGIEPGELPAAAAEAFALLSALHAGRNRRGPVETMGVLLRETGFVEASMLRPHGRQRVDNIRKALDTARAFEASRMSFRSFARWMRDQERYGSAESESPLVEEDEEAVRLLTIHRSKGLQFPVVIIVNLVQSLRPRTGRVIAGPSGRLAFDLGDGWRTPDHAEVAAEEKEKDLAETARLLYVAATRAGDMLVLPGIPGVGGGHYDMISAGIESPVGPLPAGRFPPSGGRPGEVLLLDCGDLPGAGKGGGPGKSRGAERKDAAAVEAEVARWRKGREDALAKGAVTPAVIAPSSLVQHEPAPAGSLHEGGGAAPALVGLLFHEVIESIDLSCRDIEAYVTGRLAGTERGPFVGEVARLVGDTLATPLMREAAAAEHLLREVPFSLPLSSSGGELPGKPWGFIEGRVDLLFGTGGRWSLVDLKTDSVAPGGEESRARAYRPQLLGYVMAMERLGFRLSGGAYLLFARTGAAVRVEVDGSFIEEATALVLSAAGR